MLKRTRMDDEGTILRSFAPEGGARGGGDARERGGDWTRSTVTDARAGVRV